MLQSLHVTYAFPLDQSRRELAAKRGEAYPTMEEVRSTAREWREVWRNVNQEDRIVSHLSSLTGVQLPYPVEACIIGGLFVPMSFPLIIPITDHKSTKLTANDFTHHCIHELTHRFLAPKEEVPWIRTYWDQMYIRYAPESADTRNHILVYALLKLTLPTEVNSACWEACQKIILPDYQRAFDLMQERGAEDCLAEFRSFSTGG